MSDPAATKQENPLRLLGTRMNSKFNFIENIFQLARELLTIALSFSSSAKRIRWEKKRNNTPLTGIIHHTNKRNEND